MKRSSVWLFAIAILMADSVTAAAAAAPNVTGRWAGYFDSFGARFGTAGVRGALSIQISSQDGRRFAGEICFSSASCTPVMGTVAESGEMTMTGRSAGVQSVEIHGSPFERSTAIVSTIVGRYSIMRTHGSLEQGNVVVVHQVSQDGPPADVAGMWGGHATPEGTAAARPVVTILETDRTGAITGSLGWVQADARSGMVGQAMRANGVDEIAIAGLLDDALLVANFVPSTSPSGGAARMDGSYRLIANASPASIERGAMWLRFNYYFPVSKQGEAIANLKAMFNAEKAYYQEKDAYNTHINVVGFEPERNNRYRYVLTADPAAIEDRSTALLVASDPDEGIDADVFKYPLLIYPKITSGPCVGTPTWGITPGGGTTFTGAAYGDIDSDNTLDVWTVSTASRWLSGTDCDAVGYVPAGEPANEQNDVNK